MEHKTFSLAIGILLTILAASHTLAGDSPYHQYEFCSKTGIDLVREDRRPHLLHVSEMDSVIQRINAVTCSIMSALKQANEGRVAKLFKHADEAIEYAELAITEILRMPRKTPHQREAVLYLKEAIGYLRVARGFGERGQKGQAMTQAELALDFTEAAATQARCVSLTCR